MEKFYVNLQWKPPGKHTMLTIHRIQWQTLSCCAPLRLLISEPKLINGQKAILESSTTNKKIVGLQKMLRLYTSTHPIEVDALVQVMGSQINEIAYLVPLEHKQIQTDCFPLSSKNHDSSDNLLISDRTHLNFRTNKFKYPALSRPRQL